MHLLKAGSKRIKPREKRKKIPILGSIKEFRFAESQFQSESQSQQNLSQSQTSFVAVDKPDIEIENLDGKKWFII